MNAIAPIPQGDKEELASFHEQFGPFKPITDLSELVNFKEYQFFASSPDRRSSISVTLTSTDCTKELKKNLVEPFVDVAGNALIIQEPEYYMSTIKYEAKTILTSGNWRITWAASKDFNSEQELEAEGTPTYQRPMGNTQSAFSLNTGIQVPGLVCRYVVNPDGTVTVVFDGYNPGGGGLDPVNPGGGGIIRSAPVIYMGGEYNDGYTLDL